MNIFVFNGSFRGPVSTGEKIAQIIHEECQKQFQGSQLIYRSGLNSDIKICRGCTKCFYGGQCEIVDDIVRIKEELMNSDIIVLISPVFFHNVSGIMKVFIDRIGSWTHQMRLTGKLGIIVSVSDNNGNLFVNQYMKKIMNYLGIIVVQELSITNENFDDLSLRKMIRVVIQNIQNTIDFKLLEVDEEQEKIYQNYKILYKNKMLDKSDIDYFCKNNFFKNKDFLSEFMEKCKIIGG